MCSVNRRFAASRLEGVGRLRLAYSPLRETPSTEHITEIG